MALTEIPVELSSTPGIADSSNATAITIDSSENTTFAGQVIAPNGATSGYYLKQTGGTATPRVTNDGNNWTILRPGASGADVAINNYANSANLVIFSDEGHVGIGNPPLGTGTGQMSIRVGGSGWINAHSGSASSGQVLGFSQNAHYDSDDSWEAISTDEASNYYQGSGGHHFRVAGSTSAGADITWIDALTIDGSGVTINESGEDRDFRIESDDSSTMFKVDAGNNQVSVTKALHGPGAFIVSNNSTNGTDVEAIITSLTSDSNNTNCFHMKSTTQGVASYGLRGDGSSTFTSDERLKTDIVDVEDGLLEKLNSVRFVNFKWKADPKSPVQMGVIAQELEKIFPDLVVEDDDAVGTGETYKSVSYGKLNLIAIKAIQEQQALIETLEAKVKALEEA